MDSEAQQLIQAQRAAQAAQESARQAALQVNAIQASLNAAQATSDQANQAASEAAGEFAAQRAMVGAARLRYVFFSMYQIRLNYRWASVMFFLTRLEWIYCEPRLNYSTSSFIQ